MNLYIKFVLIAITFPYHFPSSQYSKEAMSPTISIMNNVQNNITLKKTRYESLMKMVPTVTNRVLEVIVDNANTALVNAIRRTLMSEMPIRHLTVALTDIKSTDPYIISESIRKRIEMIPISQSTDMNAMFSLKYENDTNTYVDVMSTDIKLNGVSKTDDITPMIPICDINSKKSISISDIQVTESCGYDNSRSTIGRVAYEILDCDFSIASINSNPTKFRLELEMAGVMNPLDILKKSIHNLIDRINYIDFDNSITEFGIFKLTILNETYSVGQLMSYYIYKEEPSINYVANRIKHPSIRECIIDVHHPAGKSLCEKATKSIVKDLQSLLKSIK